MTDHEKVKVSEEGGWRSLVDHAVERARLARERYGPDLALPGLLAMLEDRELVRYPVRVAFDTEGLAAGMFAHAQQCGPTPREGFVLHVHPHFEHRVDDLPALIAYHLVAVNYGEIADREVAERFGAALLGLDVEAYYRRLCALADELAPPTGEGCDPTAGCSGAG